MNIFFFCSCTHLYSSELFSNESNSGDQVRNNFISCSLYFFFISTLGLYEKSKTKIAAKRMTEFTDIHETRVGDHIFPT